MAKYLLSFSAHSPSPFAGLHHHALQTILDKLDAGMNDGSLECCYSKVGGGGFMVLNAKNNTALLRELRLMGITDVDVHPVVNTREVVEGYHQHATQGVDAIHSHRVGDQSKVG